MPAIITHNIFGETVYKAHAQHIGLDIEQHFAFLLGNQGPDPLFYARANPTIMEFGRFGSTMHATNTNEMLAAFHDALDVLTEDEKPVGRAYLLGFLCHYLLDSTVHPLVYAYEYELCDAGVDGLSRKDGNEVHALIESELDEVALYVHTGKTVASYKTHKEILQASDETLNIIGKMYSYMAVMAYQRSMTVDVFRKSVKAFRLVQSIFYSQTGTKRSLLGRVEELARPYSFYRAMSHRAVEASECAFDNHEHKEWINPFTGEASSASVHELIEQAQSRVSATFSLFDEPAFSAASAACITGNMNFSGKPLV